MLRILHSHNSYSNEPKELNIDLVDVHRVDVHRVMKIVVAAKILELALRISLLGPPPTNWLHHLMNVKKSNFES